MRDERMPDAGPGDGATMTGRHETVIKNVIKTMKQPGPNTVPETLRQDVQKMTLENNPGK